MIEANTVCECDYFDDINLAQYYWNNVDYNMKIVMFISLGVTQG